MKIVQISIIFFVLLMVTQCNDKNGTISGYEGDRELKDGESVPFLLRQNYPNPFNPVTIIQFDLFIDANIKLTVYTEDWVKVRTLLDGPFNASRYQVNFDATNIPSGEYYYILSGRGYKEIRKMKLVK